ncbi:hypothetical protein AB4Z48_25345 [Cupriavidus sp. 2TAF22]|uniref:hypothetical protein n=1 Tax=unclassified Cupriavidus TaxID=2640874 RepID=UPI003F8E80D4
MHSTPRKEHKEDSRAVRPDDQPVPGRTGTATRAQDQQGEPQPRLPHEHDESHHSQRSGPRKEVEQAGRDIERGLEDTDLYATRGKRAGGQK